MIPVIDLFAGPGGLGEGFSSIRDANGNQVFQTIMSVEKDVEAHKTLRLRSFARKIQKPDGSYPRAYLSYIKQHSQTSFQAMVESHPTEWEAAEKEALHAELRDGDTTLVEEAKKRLTAHGIQDGKPWVLIGGPPCQAYSLAGRSRMAKDQAKLQRDPRQTLYKCYLAFIQALKPTAFVMENVKGLLSARHNGHGVFEHIVADMEEAGYTIHSLVNASPKGPRDYVVHAEKYGIPQARHRVILFGIRKDQDRPTALLAERTEVTLRDALAGIPKIRSGISRRGAKGGETNWSELIDSAASRLLETPEATDLADVLHRVISSHGQRKTAKDKIDDDCGKYDGWYRGHLKGCTVLANHEARTHMASDLERYLFCAAYAEVHGKAATLGDFPEQLLPNHQNVKRNGAQASADFADRFRVQVYDRYSTTITSHISKDGHYYIHPDPEQCRSLTVREAARLQTFPDDYYFESNRTSQYTQVGNAVPPLLAQQIAVIVADYLGTEAESYVSMVSRRVTASIDGGANDVDNQ